MFRFYFLMALLSVAQICFSGPAPQTLSFATVQKSLNMTNFVWDGDSLLLTNEEHHIRFYSGRRKAEVNGVTIYLNQEPKGKPDDGSWEIAAADLDFLHLSILPAYEEKSPKDLLVVLDPGHGGEDAGAPSEIPGWNEKDFTLILAKQLGTSLTNAGFRVKYTRTNDVFLSLSQRIRFAKREKADLFVSIHANHAANKGAQGFETYIVPPSGFRGTMVGSRLCRWQQGNRNDFPNTLLGFSIQKQVVSTLTNRIDRGLKRQSFYVLRENPCPAVLIEFGFLSNLHEAQQMQNAGWQSDHVHAVTRGIVSYAKKINPLDHAVAIKREADRKANAAWRAKLAAPAAKKHREMLAKIAAAPVSVSSGQHLQTAAYRKEDRQTLAAPFPLAPFPEVKEEKEPNPIEEEEGKMDPTLGESISDQSAAHQSALRKPKGSPARNILRQSEKTAPVKAKALLQFYMKKE